MKCISKICGIFTATVLAVSGMSIPRVEKISAAADTVPYPVQSFRIGVADTDRYIVTADTDDGALLQTATAAGMENEKWQLHYISEGVYEIASAETGALITEQNGTVMMCPDMDSDNQRWCIEAVEQDFEGNDLYYQIKSFTDSAHSLSFQPDGNAMVVTTYQNDAYQKFRLELDGLEGFAGTSLINGKMKAGTIGGLLGETVFVETAEELCTALDSTEPKTVVIAADIDLVHQSKEKQRIRDHKTIVGSYANHTIYDSQLRNDDFWGADDRPSEDIVIRNVNWVGRTLNSNGSGTILLQFYGVRNLWLDHNSFSAVFAQDRDNEVGKFVWINTPAAEWSDGKYNAYNPDYITISYNTFENRYWTFAFGSQNQDTSRLHTTVMYNRWEQCSRRCPQYSNGYNHNYNNYHTATDGLNSNSSSQVIAGEGSRVQNENCFFEGYTGYELDADRNLAISCYDSGSYTAVSPSDVPSPLSFTDLGTSWQPADCYGYALVDAYNTSGTDIRSFCNTYSGCFSSAGKIKYITDADLAQFVSIKYSASFLKKVEVTQTQQPAVFAEGTAYMIKNANSGQYLDVEGAAANDGTNVQQWGATEPGVQNTWRFFSAGDGYYYLASAVGDTASYVLGVANGSVEMGANIQIQSYAETDQQQFCFLPNSDGSYQIRTKITDGKSCVEVVDGSTSSGANVQQWESNRASCQNWLLEPVEVPSVTMDTSRSYAFQNENSNMVMDIEGGVMQAHTNVQQWGASDIVSQQWQLETVAGRNNLYCIRSVADLGYVLSVESDAMGGNVEIIPYSAGDTTAQFWFSKNLDGSYCIHTVASGGTYVVEVINASCSSGANVQQWESNGHMCQKWMLIPSKVATTTTTSATTSAPITTTTTTVSSGQTITKGDVNADGVFSIADAVMLQKWLIGAGHITQWQAGDLYQDGKLDVYDLSAMRSALCNLA